MYLEIEMWMFLLLACGGAKQSEECAAMVACDAGWAAADEDHDAVWMGDDDPTYGIGGACWVEDDGAMACTAACAVALQGYQEQIDILVDGGDLGGVPTGCE